MTVAFAATNPDLGGGELMMLRHARAARDLGYDVLVLAPGPSEVLDRATADGIRAVPVVAGSRREYVARLRRWARAERPPLLWCHGLLPAVATAGLPDRVVHLHQDPADATQRALHPVAARRAVARYVPSAAMAARLPGTVPLPNWTDDLPRLDARSPTEVATLGYLGRLSQDKGVDVLAHAVGLLSRTRRVRLLVAGDQRHVPPAQRRAVDLALATLGDRVELLGHVPPGRLLAQVDAAVFPSVWPEPFGLVVAEAMATGVPFVVADAGALPEVAGPGHPWTARAGDSGHLAATVAALLDAPADERRRHTDAARARWEAEFSPAAGAARVRAALDRVGG